jgi:hypothetical protein
LALGALACLLALVWAAVLGEPPTAWGAALACGLIPLAASAGWARPRSLAARVLALRAAAAALRLPGIAARLLWLRLGSGACVEPRLRLIGSAPHQGLLRIEVLVDSRPASCPLNLCVVVLADSRAARVLASWGGAQVLAGQAGRRVAFVKPVRDLGAELEALLQRLAREAQRAFEEPTREAA